MALDKVDKPREPSFYYLVIDSEHINCKICEVNYQNSGLQCVIMAFPGHTHIHLLFVLMLYCLFLL